MSEKRTFSVWEIPKFPNSKISKFANTLKSFSTICPLHSKFAPQRLLWSKFDNIPRISLMKWSEFFTSSVGKKVVMALTGLFLISFLVVHVGINSCIYNDLAFFDHDDDRSEEHTSELQSQSK